MPLLSYVLIPVMSRIWVYPNIGGSNLAVGLGYVKFTVFGALVASLNTLPSGTKEKSLRLIELILTYTLLI